MNKKQANAILRKKYGASWFERPGVKDEQRALMQGKAAPKKGSPTSKRKRDYAALAKDETKRTKAYQKKHPAKASLRKSKTGLRWEGQLDRTSGNRFSRGSDPVSNFGDAYSVSLMSTGRTWEAVVIAEWNRAREEGASKEDLWEWAGDVGNRYDGRELEDGLFGYGKWTFNRLS